MSWLGMVVWVGSLCGVVPLPPDALLDNAEGFWVTPGTSVVVADDLSENERADLIALGGRMGVDLRIERASEHRYKGPAIYVGERERNEALDRRKVNWWTSGAADLGPEGYLIASGPQLVVVVGADPAGTFYGLRMLGRLVAERGYVPYGRVLDAPDIAIRGVVLRNPVSANHLEALADEGVNLVVFQHQDLYLLDDEGTARRWQEVFRNARRFHIEPVPLLRLQEDAGLLVARAPAMAGAQPAEASLVLEGDDWAMLPHRNIVEGPDAPVEVTLEGRRLTEGDDYVIDREPLRAPFRESSAPWLIRRIPGRDIPDEAKVTVHYLIVHQGITQYCFDVVAGRDFLKRVIGELVEILGAETVHVGWGPDLLPPLDPRSRLGGASQAEIWQRFVEIFAPEAGPVRWMAWAGEPGRVDVMDSDPDEMPVETLTLCMHARSQGNSSPAVEKWASRVPVVLMPGPESVDIYECLRSIEPISQVGERLFRGVLLPAEVDEEALRFGMTQAWRSGSVALPWPEGLNTYFDAKLWDPEPDEVLTVLVGRLNRQTLHGVAPQDERKRFLVALEELRARIGREAAGYEEATYGLLSEWVELEEAFSRRPDEWILRKTAKLVEKWAAMAPGFDSERRDRILEGVERGLFVPSSILFREFVLPFRPVTIAQGNEPLAVVGNPAYRDFVHETEAEFDFMAAPGPIWRVDFDTAGASALRLETSADGERYQQVAERTAVDPVGVRGPVILREPVSARFLRVVATSAAEAAVLRDVQVFALKAQPVAKCAGTNQAPVLDASFKEDAWPRQAQVSGFVREDGRAFAEAQTTVRIVHDREALYVGAYMREPRMGTRMMQVIRRDGEVEEDESFEVLLESSLGVVYRFVVNPMGVQRDEQSGDVGWDAPWKAVAKDYSEGWAVELAIPWEGIGGPPRRGATWLADFRRNRRNVVTEQSAWAAGSADWRGVHGEMRFE